MVALLLCWARFLSLLVVEQVWALLPALELGPFLSFTAAQGCH